MRQTPSTIVAVSSSFRNILHLTAQYAPRPEAVLICGESGTGKELIAHAIHAGSGRSGPLVPVNCAAISATLLESELFGHEEGSFTGATHRRLGKIELAHGGTLFLDEIADLEPKPQAALLRVLEDGVFSRVGGETDIKVDVRVVAATNQNLEELVDRKRFREDLFMRLNPLRLDLAPFRERPDDIAALAQHFAKHLKVILAPDAVLYLQSLRLRGNARELKARILRVAAAKIELVTAEELIARESPRPPRAESLPPPEDENYLSLKEGKLLYTLRRIADALKRSEGNLARAALHLGESRQALHAFLQKHRQHPLLEGFVVKKT